MITTPRTRFKPRRSVLSKPSMGSVDPTGRHGSWRSFAGHASTSCGKGAQLRSGTTGRRTSFPISELPTPSSSSSKHSTPNLFNQAIGALPPGLREMIVLREVEGMAYREIAAVIDHPIGTVMSRLSLARRRLQELL